MADIEAVYEAEVAEHYICALEYDDETGLSDEESEQLANWLTSLPEGSFLVIGEEAGFCRCEVSGMMADCVKVQAYRSIPAANNREEESNETACKTRA